MSENNISRKIVLYVQNSRKRKRISFFIGLDFKVFSKRGSRETAALVFDYIGCRLLSGNYQVVVFLAFLSNDIFAVEKHVGRSRCVSVGDFLLIDGETSLLGEFAHLAFRR